jgi:uncharacterized integral membrane protein
MKGYLKATGLVIMLLFLVTFGIKNDQLVKLHYYFGLHSQDFPLYILAYGCAIIGIFIGMIIGLTNRFHQRKKIKVLENENSDLKARAEKEKKKEVKPWDQKVEEKFPEKKFFDEKTLVEKRPEKIVSDEKIPEEKDSDEKTADEKDEETQITT